MIDEPTIGERYQRAMTSSDLTLRQTRAADVDLLIAAGWLREGLGTLLYRLQGEYDMVRGEMGLAHAELQRVVDEELKPVREQEMTERSRMDFGPTRARFWAEEAERVLKRGADAALTARALALVHLKTLDSAKRALGAFAIRLSARRSFETPAKEVLNLTGRVLDVWLDPHCGHCSGRGTNGGYGTPETVCRPCRGSGTRRVNIARNAEQQMFVGRLLSEMDRCVSRVETELRTRRRDVAIAKFLLWPAE